MRRSDHPISDLHMKVWFGEARGPSELGIFRRCAFGKHEDHPNLDSSHEGMGWEKKSREHKEICGEEANRIKGKRLRSEWDA